jgi:hypothetical protein
MKKSVKMDADLHAQVKMFVARVGISIEEYVKHAVATVLPIDQERRARQEAKCKPRKRIQKEK